MEESLPSSYDVIVVGTGLVESLVAAACARIGKKVLHLDRNPYYGQLWATLGLECFENFLVAKDDCAGEFEGGGFAVRTEFSKVSDVFQKWFIPENVEEVKVSSSNDPSVQKLSEDLMISGDEPTPLVENSSQPLNSWSVSEIKSQSRKFNIDLMPKFIYSQGPMVQLLVESKVSRYLEFLNVTNILSYVKSSIDVVPCCKADVFSNKNLTVVDKRILMKQLEIILEYSESSPLHNEWKLKPFSEYLEHKKISDKLKHYLIYAIAMVTENTSFDEAVSNIKEFLKNLGHYGGNSPFLWPLYGSGEVLQAFCRLSAVYGGIYYLNRGIECINLNEETKLCTGVTSNQTSLSADFVVISSSYLPSSLLSRSDCKETISRAVLITDRSLVIGEKKESISLLNLPYGKDNQIMLIELSSSTGACPKNLYLVHVICRNIGLKADSLLDVLNPLFSSETSKESQKPNILYYAFFNIQNFITSDYDTDIPKNLKICSGPNVEVDFKSSISEAKEMFSSMYPGCTFLEPMPDPNEESSLLGDDKCEDSCESKNEDLPPEETLCDDSEAIVS